MKKILWTVIATFSLCVLLRVEGYASSLNTSNYLNYAAQSVSTSTWKLLANQPANTIHRITIKDTSSQVLELGVGAPGAQTRLLMFGPGLGSSAETVSYPIGISFAGVASSVWIRGVQNQVQNGELVINLLY